LGFWMRTSRLMSEMALVRGMPLGQTSTQFCASRTPECRRRRRARKPLFLEDLAGGVIVEELDLGDGGCADESRSASLNCGQTSMQQHN